MSLNGTYDDNNLFARILRGEIPAVKVYEDGDVLAFMDIFPQTRGHLLVVPKNVKALEPDGVTVTQFNGEDAGQTIFHLHFHIIPRYAGQRLAGHGHGNKADIAELQKLAAEIAAQL